MNEIKLKSCPVCGKEAELHRPTDRMKLFGFYVGCTKCGLATDWCLSAEEAIKAWNRREGRG